MKQRVLDLRTWDGARPGAGRKPAAERRRIAHAAREPFRASHPVHVSLRLADHVWSLRSERSYAVVHGALDAVRGRPAFRVAHFSIQANHLHLIVEADGPGSLSNGIRALAIRIARRLNVMMGHRGPVFEDRFHAHVLRTPTEVRNALRYVAEDHANHRERLGLPAPREKPDPLSSSVEKVPLGGQMDLWSPGVNERGADVAVAGGGVEDAPVDAHLAPLGAAPPAPGLVSEEERRSGQLERSREPLEARGEPRFGAPPVPGDDRLAHGARARAACRTYPSHFASAR